VKIRVGSRGKCTAVFNFASFREPFFLDGISSPDEWVTGNSYEEQIPLAKRRVAVRLVLRLLG
jgi:hypothetical protein